MITPIEPPPTPMLRRSAAMQWLQQHGISEWEFRQLESAGVIHRRILRTGGRYYFSRDQLLRDVIEKQ